MQLLQHFKILSLHPKNVAELKGLILQLAIQGKLTAQWRKDNPEIESASVLLEKIEEEKAKLIAEKKIKKEKFEEIESGKEYFAIPDKWEWQKLGQIGNIFNGNSVNKSVKEAKYRNLEEGLPYIGTKDVGYFNEPINYNNGVKIPYNEPKFKTVRKGTVLICSEGGSAGKKMGVVEETVCFGNKLYALEQYGNIQTMFIQAYYGSKSFESAFKETMTGIIGGVSRNSFANLIIPIPPLEEQKAIVAIVNQLLAEVEQLEQLTKKRVQLKAAFVTSALRQLTESRGKDTAQQWEYLQPHFSTFFTEKENVKKLRESILQLAVQGKLTRAWRESHPELVEGSHSASTLLEKIKAEKAELIKAGKIKKEKPLPPITEEEIPYEIPESWVWCKFQNILKDLRYGTSKKCDYNLGKDPVLRIPNISNGKIDLGDLKSTNLTEKEVVDLSLDNGDLLIIRSNGSESLVGRSAVVSEIKPGYSFAGYLVRARIFNSFTENAFLHFILESPFIRKSIEGPIRTTSGVKNINSTEISQLLFAIPSKEEQKVIVEKVNALMALCDGLETEIENQQNTQEQWMQACLREVLEEKSTNRYEQDRDKLRVSLAAEGEGLYK
jgi:type I restriction enzyme S subunit